MMARSRLFLERAARLADAIRSFSELEAILVVRHAGGHRVCLDGHLRLRYPKVQGCGESRPSPCSNIMSRIEDPLHTHPAHIKVLCGVLFPIYEPGGQFRPRSVSVGSVTNRIAKRDLVALPGIESGFEDWVGRARDRNVAPWRRMCRPCDPGAIGPLTPRGSNQSGVVCPFAGMIPTGRQCRYIASESAGTVEEVAPRLTKAVSIASAPTHDRLRTT